MGNMSLSVQIVDAVYGIRAAGIAVRLDRFADGTWTELEHSCTGEDGQADFWPCGPVEPGAYRLSFGTDSYFVGLGVTAFYPAVTVEFRMPDPSASHQVRLLLTPSSFLVFRLR
jgi:5-hydroxyisourate hydrolase